MFKAIVIACVIGAPNDCVEFHDYRGPWETKAQCKSRALEISRDVAKIANLIPTKWRCKTLKEGMLT